MLPRLSIDPALVTALVLLAPACTDLETADDLGGLDEAEDLSDAEALPLPDDLAALDEDELAERFGGDPGVSLPGSDELGAELDPLQVGGETPMIWAGVRRYVDYQHLPLYAEAAWASPDTPNCSGTMIGPNLLMVAASCAADENPEITVQARVYREADLEQKHEADYECELLFHTFPETDLAIYHCPPEPGKLSLGDRFGWADLALTAPAEGDYLFSVFSDDIDTVAPDEPHHLITFGEVLETFVDDHWANPNYPHGYVFEEEDQAVNQLPRVVHSELWHVDGARGSAQFDLDGRAIVGPTTDGTNDGPGRYGLGTGEYLYRGWIYERYGAACPYSPVDPECHTDNSVYASHLWDLGLNPTDYEGGFAGRNQDRYFDVAADVSELEGENPKDLYHLRFSSRQQNLLWSEGPHADVEYDGDGLVFDTELHAPGTWAELARHQHLPLMPYQTYSVTLEMTSDDGYYSVCLPGPTGMSCAPYVHDDSGTPTSHTFEIHPSTAGQHLVVQGYDARGSIQAVTIAQHWVSMQWLPGQGFVSDETVTLDFDTFDQRNAWRDPDSGGRPRITPDGEGDDIDWAGYLLNLGWMTGYDYDLSTTALPIANGQNTICFKHRRDPAFDWDDVYLYMRVQRQNGAWVTSRAVMPGIEWAQTCRTFNASVADGEALEVRFALHGTGVHEGAAFIDDVELTIE